jgi:DNA primase
VRLGLGIIIQNPALALGVDDAHALASLDMPGIPLMIELIRLIQGNPGLNTASILERYRNSQHHKHLEKLAIWDHMIPEKDLGQELDAVVLQLRSRLVEQQVSQLLQKANLSAEEKSELRALLNRRSN